MSTCDCSSDFGEKPEFYEQRIVHARKKYRCIECDEVIEIGDRYEYFRGLWDGEFETYRICLPCASIRNVYCPNGSVFGELRDILMDCLGIDYITN